jgi:hypothetical protein
MTKNFMKLVLRWMDLITFLIMRRIYLSEEEKSDLLKNLHDVQSEVGNGHKLIVDEESNSRRKNLP